MRLAQVHPAGAEQPCRGAPQPRRRDPADLDHREGSRIGPAIVAQAILQNAFAIQKAGTVVQVEVCPGMEFFSSRSSCCSGIAQKQ